MSRSRVERRLIKENLAAAAYSCGRSVAEAISEQFDRFPNLKPLEHRKGGVLSGGEQQSLAFARALCTQPKVLMLDEPTEGIQPSIVRDIARQISKLAKDYQITFLVVEQNIRFLSEISDKVQVMKKRAH